VEGLRVLSEAQKTDIQISGEKNLLTNQDLNPNQVVNFMEQKNAIVKMLDNTFSDLSIIFGDENEDFIIGNSSMVVSKYKKGDVVAGALGIVGPMRLDYQKVIPYLKFYTEKITNLITEKGEEGE
jgi:heat-inducible transcriptional repressor